jgi:hypothetical protein
MPNSDPVGTNPNDKMPSGDGLKPGEVVPEEFEDEKLYGNDDGLGPRNEDEDEPGLPEDTEMNTATEAVRQYDRSSGGDVDETLAGGLQYPDGSKQEPGR